MARRIIVAHLQDDLSGSARVLRQSIEVLLERKEDVRLYVGDGHQGWLAGIDIPVVTYRYRRPLNRLARLGSYLLSQAHLFLLLLLDRKIGKEDIIYVNTILPIGAALYAKCTSKKLIYHLHELAIPAPLLSSGLRLAVKWLADVCIFVSSSHQKAWGGDRTSSIVVFNCVDPVLRREAATAEYSPIRDGVFTVLMLSAPRAYKGVPEFLELARQFGLDQNIRFVLVNSGGKDEMAKMLGAGFSVPNLIIHERTSEVASLFKSASVVLNLTRTDLCVESFGLTIVEALAFGVPVIVPPIGGPAEIVVDGVQGFHVDSRSSRLCGETIRLLANDEALCMRMSVAARSRSLEFSEAKFREGICGAIRMVSGMAQ